MTPQQFQTLLLTWFDQAGRKHLPWQQNKTAYRVWISEIMLQQTQVSTVIPYFERFMSHFPDVHTLANASDDEVLHLWAGLGYYSRARNLHRSSKIIVDQHHGQLPHTLEDLIALPGIGQSTAGAILAIAFNQPATILDGNVKRVLARLHRIVDPINEKPIENHLWKLAHGYTPAKRVADYTQAMMDLGATLCTPRKPQCTHCPIAIYCIAHQEDIAEQLPKKKAARALPTRQATFIIIQNKQYVLLSKRPPKGIWGGLWSLPELPGQAKDQTIRQFCQQQIQITATHLHPLTPFRHTFTHYHLDIFPVLVTTKKSPRLLAESTQIWYNLSQPTNIGLPKPVQTLLRGLV